MKRLGINIAIFSSMFMVSVVQAAVISFTPSGTSTVSQSTNLYWDMLSSATSTSSFGATGNFYLSDHGDFHFDTGANANMVVVVGTEGGAKLPQGTPIGAGSDWSLTSFVGTTDYDGTMVPVETAYFGLRFEVAGQTHYGWVQIQEGTSDQSVLAWAYESTPGVPIAAGASTGGEAAIPTLAGWATILLVVLLTALGASQLRRRSHKLA
jgi:hypothetical protein